MDITLVEDTLTQEQAAHNSSAGSGEDRAHAVHPADWIDEIRY